MSQTRNQVARVTYELRVLLVHLHWSAFQGFKRSDENPILNDLVDASLIEDLRTTIDEISHFLWSYVESVATDSAQEPDYDQQSKRLMRVTEMLRVLHRPARPAEDPMAFVDRLTRAVDRHLESSVQQELRPASGASNNAGGDRMPLCG